MMNSLHPFFAWFFWNPHREIITIPYIDRPIGWYGLCFVLGFFIAYRIFGNILYQELSKNQPNDPSLKSVSLALADKALWYILIGTIAGARLGHVFFYDWPKYQNHLLDILKIWEGGLASHGGAIGVILALILFHRNNQKNLPGISLIKIIDLVCIPTALVAFFIRIGNFFNQEILGFPTSLPWGIIFGRPADGGPIVPRHPAQLYEAICYLLIFIFLYAFWKIKNKTTTQGVISGLFFILVFTSRFFIEFIKVPQSMIIDESIIQMGQYLSIPFILAGVILFFWGDKFKRKSAFFI